MKPRAITISSSLNTAVQTAIVPTALPFTRTPGAVVQTLLTKASADYPAATDAGKRQFVIAVGIPSKSAVDAGAKISIVASMLRENQLAENAASEATFVAAVRALADTRQAGSGVNVMAYLSRENDKGKASLLALDNATASVTYGGTALQEGSVADYLLKNVATQSLNPVSMQSFVDMFMRDIEAARYPATGAATRVGAVGIYISTATGKIMVFELPDTDVDADGFADTMLASFAAPYNEATLGEVVIDAPSAGYISVYASVQLDGKDPVQVTGGSVPLVFA